MREIEFTIDASTGELTMYIKGMRGPSCRDVAKLAAELLGEPKRDWSTPEYYLQPTVQPRTRPRREQ